MATVAILVGSAIVNAIALTAGSALYDKFGRSSNDGSQERIKHDRAIEDLQKASLQWNQKRQDTLDYINHKIREKNESRETFDDVDVALNFYNETHPDGVLDIPRKPVLEDFYKPSNEQKYYEVVVVAGVSSILGYFAFKLI